MSTEKMIVHDVIVIGAGISGLSGAKLLREFSMSQPLDVLVLEARDRVGGRTFTVKNSTVGWVDLGGAYVGRGQNHLLRLIKEFGLQMYNVNEVENLVFFNYESGKRRLCHFDEMPDIGFLAKLDFYYILRLMDKMAEEIPAKEPWLASHAEQWDKMSFKEFIEQNVFTKEIRNFMRIFIETCVTNEMHESSLLWFLWYVKQCGGTKPIFSTTGGGQEFKVHGGTNQISEHLMQKVGKDRVHLNEPVYQIEQFKDKVRIRTLNGKEYYSQYVIMATPPCMQQKIHYEPPLPPMRNQLIQRASMGSVLKCIVYYKTTFWRDMDMCGSLIIYGDDDFKCPITYTLDDTKPDGTHPAIIGFMPADKARKLIDLTKEERLKLICDCYAKAFDCDEARYPIHYEEQNWMSEQYSGGCYTMVCAPGFLTRYGPYLRKPFGRLYYAGTETSSQWSGYMNGAVEAGERAAREILVEMGKLDKHKIMSEEPVSKEYPPLEIGSSWIERNSPSVKSFLTGMSLATISLTALAIYFGWKRYELNQYWQKYISAYIIEQ